MGVIAVTIVIASIDDIDLIANAMSFKLIRVGDAQMVACPTAARTMFTEIIMVPVATIWADSFG